MGVNSLHQDSEKYKKTALSNNEVKGLLEKFDIALVPELFVHQRMEVVAAARKIGFPVVLKGMGANLLHKTDRGLVHLNLLDSQAVENAVRSIVAEASNDLDGFLIQPQIKGRREFVAGLFQDRQFGPVIMFGVGGVFTEAFADVVFRLAPLSEIDAAEMLEEIQGNALLGNIRGEKAVRRDELIQTLLGLSRIAEAHPEISEIDINPLLVTPEGRVVAVDALVVTGGRPVETEFLPPLAPDAIGSLFYPKSVAIVGASAQIGKWGHTLMANTISGGYEGPIYPVNPKGGTIAGRKVFRSVAEIPGKIGLAAVTIPADKVLDLIPEFRKKGIRNMLLITSGFGEIGMRGKDLEDQLVKAAQEANVLVLGPNTMGICNPHNKLYCTGSPVMPLPGSTAMVAQSGNMGIQLLAFAEQQGIGIRAFCGSGNEAMMTIEDYLDGFEVDTLTRTVILYVESVKNGRRFFNSARRVGKKKPIVLLKGGRSAAGNRAAASHTGAMTSDIKIFEAACRQAGIVMAQKPMDLLDLAAAFSSLPLPDGKRAAIVTLGGGWGVVTADLCAEYDLEVPELSSKLIAKMDRMLPAYWSRSNPIDLVGDRDPSIPITAIEELVKWDGCDAVINLGIMGRRIMVKRFGQSVLKSDPQYDQDFIDQLNQQFLKFEKEYIEHIVKLMEKFKKPIFGVSLLPDEKNQTLYRVAGSKLKGVFYPTPERAVKSFAKMVEYNRFLKKL
ncbi:MAG: acetate--CoA ligase family protein [Deltaproteobacteria bacterium]|jgi:acyl-CoA synthetase (NDP forming)|nr:acetate--CoA ligase family protein [Deltaproteobacteria bacterium]MBW2582756.1 acetate--CoA ligase family protein [Deltaproteobacteria bacterium]